MALPVVTNGYLSTVNFTTSSGLRAACVFAWTAASGTPATLASAVLSDYQTAFRPRLATSTTIGPMLTYKLDGISAPISSNVTATGTYATGAYLPPNCTTGVTLRTANRGGSYRGRMYLPFPVDEFQSTTPPSIWTTAHLSAMVTAANTFMVSMNTASRPWGVLSRKLGVITPITNIGVDARIDTQRRRLGKDIQ